MPDDPVGDSPTEFANASVVDSGAFHPSTELSPRNHWLATFFQVAWSIGSSTLKKIRALTGPPAAPCSCNAVLASATPPSNPRVKSEGEFTQPGLPY